MPAERREPLVVQGLPVGRVIPHAADAVLAREDKAVRAARAGNGGGVHLDDPPVKNVVVGSLHERYRESPPRIIKTLGSSLGRGPIA